MRKFFLPVAIVLAGFVVTAALAEPVALERLAQFFKGGFYVGALSPASANNKVTKSVASGSITYDAPSVDGGLCISSASQTVTGAAVLDTCELGPNATAAAVNGAVLSCYVDATNGVTLKVCNTRPDTSIDLASGAYRVRTFSNQ